MRVFLAICAVIGYVAAEAGYQYNAPHVTYGTPSFGGSSGGSSGGSFNRVYQQASSAPSVSYASSAPSVSYQSSGFSAQPSYSHNAGYQSSNTQTVVKSVPLVSYQSVKSAAPAAASYYQSSSSNAGYSAQPSVAHNAGYHAATVQHAAPVVSHSYQQVQSAPSVSVSHQNIGSGSGNGFSSGGFGGQSAGNGFSSSGFGGQSGGSSYQASQYSGSANYQGSSQYQSSASIVQSGPAQVYKHFYVHAAPDEPESKSAAQVTIPAPQKHYKVIFIKAPSSSSSRVQYVPVPNHSEEKTVVYVLSKKAEDAQSIAAPLFEAKPPSKPEVFFVKYNKQQDTGSVINNIVSEYNNQQPGLVSFSGIDSVSSGGASGNDNGGAVNVASVGDSGSHTYTTVTGNSGNNGGSGSSGALIESNSGSGYYTGGDAGGQTQSFIVSGGGGSSSNGGGASLGGESSQGSSSSIVVSGGNDASFSTATSQSIPHETYGSPSFRVARRS